MKFDLIITTYNRPKKVLMLVKSIFSHIQYIHNIIIVDSSDICQEELKEMDHVLYIHSLHKNQPYQRFLGYKLATKDWILFLDDDMEFVSNDVFPYLTFLKDSKPEIVGIAIHFEDKHMVSSLTMIPKTLFTTRSIVLKKIRSFTGYLSIPIGKFGLVGLKGPQPKNGGYTEWVSGGAFLAKRDKLFIDFNFQLFDLFEKNLGMGEDSIIGYTLSKQGKIFYSPNLLFYHNDQKDSHYSMNHFLFGQRVAFSRLYLTLEKLRLDNKVLVIGYFFYNWFIMWRIVGLIFNTIITWNKVNFYFLMGFTIGWIKTWNFKYNSDFNRENY